MIAFRNYKIDYLKALAAILVVFGHVLNYYNKNYTHLGIIGSEILVLVYAVHVPLFIIIAGYLCHDQPVLQFYKKKVTRVLIPFLFFTALKIVWNLLLSGDYHNTLTIKDELINGFVFGNTYWFAYAICLLYVLSPAIWIKGKKEEPIGAWITFLVTLIANIVLWALGISLPNIDTPFQIGNVLFYCPFYVCGYLIKYYSKTIEFFVFRFKKHIVLICIGIIVFSVLLNTVFEVKSIGNKYPVAFPLGVSLSVLLYCLTLYLKAGVSILHDIGQYSYQIMLLDAFYKTILFKIFGNIINIPIVLAIFLLDIILGIITCKIVKNVPGVRFLFGLQDNRK